MRLVDYFARGSCDYDRRSLRGGSGSGSIRAL